MDEHRYHPPVVEDLPPPSDNLPPETRRRRRWPWLVLLLLVAGVAVYALFLRGNNGSAGAGQAPAATSSGRSRGPMVTPVVATKAVKGNIGVYYTGLGAVTPIYTVTVKTRVDGQLMKVLYKEGDTVKQGDLLAEIDSRPYEAQLTQYEGQLLKDQAALDNARLDLNRYQTLVAQNAAPEQQLATQKAVVEQDEGTVKSDQGLIQATRVNLAYCHIAAPITGRIGLRLVDPGNIVHASDATGLLVITQVQPMSVIFTLHEEQIPAVLQKVRLGQRLQVDAYDPNKTKLESGWLSTLDNQIDPTTGTLKLRATFDNRGNKLFPNQFVNARLLVEEKRGVTLVPTAVVQRNSQMTYAYLIKPDSTVTVRPINVGVTEGDQSEITSGLSPGDVLVMTGVDRLQEGSKVTVHFDGGPGGNAGGANPGNRGSGQGMPSPGGASPSGAAGGRGKTGKS